MDLDDIYQTFILENQQISATSEVKIAFDVLRSKLNKLALEYNNKNQHEHVNLIDTLNSKIGDLLEQYETMVIRYSPQEHRGIKVAR